MKEANEELARKIKREGKSSVDIGKVEEVHSNDDSGGSSDEDDANHDSSQSKPEAQYIEMVSENDREKSSIDINLSELGLGRI